MTYILDGKGALPEIAPRQAVRPVDAPKFALDPVQAEAGKFVYMKCLACHGMAAVSGGAVPDLRASQVPLDPQAFDQIVRRGALQARGMPAFDEITQAQLEQLRHYISKRARDTLSATK